MKKIMCIVLILMLVLTACGSQETTKTEEELKAEILADLKAEADNQSGQKSEVGKNDNKPEDTGITETETTKTDEGEEVTKRDDVFYPEDLVKGIKVSNKLTIDHFESGDMGSESISLKLKSDKFLKGVLYCENERFFVRFDEDLFDKNVLVKNELALNGEEEFDFNEYIIFPIDDNKLLLPPEYIAHLKNGAIIQGDLYVKEINYESNPEETIYSAVITEVSLDDGEIERLNKEDNKLLESSKPDVYLSGFETEALYSKDSSFTVDYSKYSLVVVPMQDSKNVGKLDSRVVEISKTGYEPMLKFSVFGTLYNVKVTRMANGEKLKEVFIADKIENECVYLNDDLPTDAYSVLITGNYQYQSGLEEVSFYLDDMRNPEAHPIITVDSYSFPTEGY